MHHGAIVIVPPPKKGHQEVQGHLLILLMSAAGESWVVRVEMAFRPTPEHEVWQADVGCVSRKRDAATGPDEYLMGAPELVVEVLSPSNTVDEINDKMAICMANGCLSFWTMDGKRKRVLVTEGDVTKHYSLSDSISCSLFPTAISVDGIFGDSH